MVRHSPVYQSFIDETVALADPKQSDVCLDLGCGPGFFTMALASRGGRVIGVDFAPRMFALAQAARSRWERAQPRSPNHVELVDAEVSAWLAAQSSDSADVIVASLLLSYLFDPADFLAHVRRVLRPRGRFVMSNPVPHARFSRIFWRSGWRAWRYLPYAIRLLRYGAEITRLERDGAARFYSPEDTRRLLAEAGFPEADWTIRPAYAETCILTRAIK